MQLEKIKIIRYFKMLILIILAWIITHSLFITVDGLFDHAKKSDIAIVFGSKVNTDGYASERLKARLNVAIKLYNNKLIDFILVSGGIGKEGFDEAVVMKKYLIKNGVDDKKIITDNQGNNTYLTAINFVELNKDYQFKSAILVSQFFHLSRSKMIFRKIGFKELGTAHAEFFEWRDFYSLLREFPAYYSNLLR